MTLAEEIMHQLRRRAGRWTTAAVLNCHCTQSNFEEDLEPILEQLHAAGQIQAGIYPNGSVMAYRVPQPSDEISEGTAGIVLADLQRILDRAVARKAAA